MTTSLETGQAVRNGHHAAGAAAAAQSILSCHTGGGGAVARQPGQLMVALIGQPNVGKSTVFNMLTGLSQHVGNWPGKTVEQKVGTYRQNDQAVSLVDLPGTYSLT